MVYKRLLIAAEEGWLPKQAAYIGKRGTPVVLLTIFTLYLIHKKNPEAMAKTTFPMKKTTLYVLTTIGLADYVMAAILNFSDIENAWQMMLVYFAVVIAYAFIREKKVK